MKIALLYSGSFRNLAETLEENIAYFKGNEIHLYFSVWDHMGYVDHLNAPDYLLSNRLLRKDQKVSDSLIRSFVPEEAEVKAVKVEKYNADKYSLNLVNGANPNLAAQYYKIWDCFTLLEEEGETYDAVVRMRCDVLLKKKIRTKKIKELVDNNKIIFNTKIWYDHPKTKEARSINEMIWISNKDLMKKACNIYNNADKINEIIKKNEQKDLNYGESICYMNLEAEGITENVELFDFDYRVMR